MTKMIGYFVIGVIALGLIVFLSLLFAFPTMWLVNNVFSTSFITSVFGSYEISIWQAWGLNFLCGMLFKSTMVNSK